MKAPPKKSGLVRVFAGPPHGRKRAEASLRDRKTLTLYRAACGLLASNDFEAVSVSRLAEAGGCSIGAFYGRFPDKEAFLRFLITETFEEATVKAERDLGDDAVKGLGFSQRVRKIVGHISSRFADGQTAGLVRAAVKLGFSDSKARKPLDDYRNAVTDRALALLAPHIKRGGEENVREAMQIVFGSLIDAILTRGGLFRAGALPANDALCSAFTALAKGDVKRAKPSVAAKVKEKRAFTVARPPKSAANSSKRKPPTKNPRRKINRL